MYLVHISKSDLSILSINQVLYCDEWIFSQILEIFFFFFFNAIGYSLVSISIDAAAVKFQFFSPVVTNSCRVWILCVKSWCTIAFIIHGNSILSILLRSRWNSMNRWLALKIIARNPVICIRHVEMQRAINIKGVELWRRNNASRHILYNRAVESFYSLEFLLVRNNANKLIAKNIVLQFYVTLFHLKDKILTMITFSRYLAYLFARFDRFIFFKILLDG